MRKQSGLTTTRRGAVVGVMAGVAATMLPRLAAAQTFPRPKTPLAINVIDVAGDLQLSQPTLERFAEAHRDLVAKFNLSQAPAPELAGKLKAQQSAGRVDIDLGTDRQRRPGSRN